MKKDCKGTVLLKMEPGMPGQQLSPWIGSMGPVLQYSAKKAEGRAKPSRCTYIVDMQLSWSMSLSFSI